MNHLRLVRDDEAPPIKCECVECGKTWLKGEQDDNETLCLRCEYLESVKAMDDEDYGHDLDDDECEELDQ